MTAAALNPSVLVVDDDPDALTLATETLSAGGIGPVTTMRDGRLVGPYLADHRCGLVLLDLGMPYCDGRELISEIASTYPDVSVLVISGTNEVSTAVSCIHRGAYDYLLKPYPPHRLIDAVRRARGSKLVAESITTAQVAAIGSPFAEIITQHPAMREIFAYVQAIATTGQPVLITGETGTGKDLIARAVHRISACSGEYVAVNVGGLDDAMFADSLFGHRKGAFAGATDSRPGLVLRASSGTLFLDEIVDLSLISQVKLLRLLQDGEYYPLGSDLPKHASARIVVATSQDLRQQQEAGRFRKDLFYRLNAHHVHLPPLRDRPSDIPVLLDHFLAEASATFGRPTPEVPAEVRRLLSGYAFPGNVRELRSLVYDALTRTTGRTLAIDPFRRALCDPIRSEASTALRFPDRLPNLREVHEQLIGEALKRAGGNQALAASFLGITRQGLNKRLRSGET
ncbi:MAG: sigma-54-dependent Fis family transcriptional regulator [Planctomycetes bacterium]|nr:sigma-54-dependent Fis family transcriptional regulator [Planctomycetota bacterium]